MFEVYLAYDRTGALLYVGHTAHFVQRKSNHKRKSAWYSRCKRFVRREYRSRDRAFSVERRAISMLKPIYNVAHQRPEPRPLTGVPYSDHLAAASREFEQLCSTYSIDELRVFMPRNLPKPKKRKAK